jgi:hypothetical protein
MKKNILKSWRILRGRKVWLQEPQNHHKLTTKKPQKHHQKTPTFPKPPWLFWLDPPPGPYANEKKRTSSEAALSHEISLRRKNAITVRYAWS